MSRKPTSLISDLQRAKDKRSKAFQDVRNNIKQASFGHQKRMTVPEIMNHVRSNSQDYHDLCERLR